MAWTGPSPLDAVFRAEPDLAEALGGGDLGASLDELTDWGRSAALAVNGAAAAVSVLVQGMTALFYLSLRPAVAALAAEPPP